MLHREPAQRRTSPRLISSLQKLDAVLCWNLGNGGHALEHADSVANAAKAVRALDPTTPLEADVWDGYQKYARTVSMLSVHRWPLLTSLELPLYRDWLVQRRLLAQPPRGENEFMWTWVQTHLPDWYTQLVYARPGSAGFAEPIGPQPEHIRLLTYIALGSGCRGIGFWSDRFLADSHQGRDRLLTLALLNMEMQMLEPMLMTDKPPTWIDTSVPEVKAAVFRAEAAASSSCLFGWGRVGSSCPVRQRPPISASSCHRWPAVPRPGKCRPPRCAR